MSKDRNKVFNTFKYRFYLEGQKEPISHEVVIYEDGHSRVDDPEELELFKSFTELDNNKCEHCPLSNEEVKHCPAAMNLASVINTFKEIKTSSEVTIEVETNQRTYSYKGVLTRGLHSLVGLAMASSECPHMKFLRPMAMFHLPYADANETIIRSMSFWLLKNYLKKPEEAIDFNPLFKKYGDVEKINAAMMERIRTFEVDDTGMHAIVILDSFISIFGLKFEGNMDELRKILDDE
ncbi:MAG: hypothetical protein OEY33_09590 [Bdellovibrionales bacterium]|jgi:hypothetical protein|nr:hypothetical protein [Bdellovibrionales bacterium]